MYRAPVLAAVISAALLTATAADASGGQRFILSPSGNISCELDSASAAGTQVFCETFEPAQAVTMTARGRLKLCRGVGCIGQPPENAHRLPYGRRVRLGPFVCASAATGMTCTLRSSGAGFAIARSGVTRV